MRALAEIGCAPETIIDVGASNAQWSRAALESFPSAAFVLYEPQAVHFSDLDRFERERGQQVSVVQKAVGRSSGTTLFDASDPFGGALQQTPSAASITVPLTSLDESLSELGAKPPFLVKLDTHGYEFSILEGGAETLRQSVAWIIEAYNIRLTSEGMLFWELCAYMQERGFRPVDLVDVLHRRFDQTLWQMDIFFIRDTWPGFERRSYG